MAYFGQIGERLFLEVRYIDTTQHRCKPNPSFKKKKNNNFFFIHTFKDKNGFIFKWRTDTIISAKTDCTYTIKATIAGHKQFRGVDETKISRVKFLKERNVQGLDSR